MCGIFGYIVDKQLDDNIILQSLNRRGPDSKGVYKFNLTENRRIKKAALLHTRLSIIDLSGSADQPMQDNSGNYIIIYNGEIYNFKELRTELEKESIIFRTNSDTEVILLGYKKWGVHIVPKLRGMFSFCIYDKKNGKMFLARDHFGMKPLYYYKENNNFCFSSTVSTILKSGIKNKFKLDTNAIEEYFNIGSFLAPHTIIKSIKALLPGNYMIYDNGKILINNYYSIKKQVTTQKYDYETTKIELRKLLFDTVEKHLISDAPLGVFLSGGIDSSLIAAIASKISKEKIHTFSIGFKGLKNFQDETSIAEKTSHFIGSIHENISLNNNSFKENFDEFIDAIDVPSIDGLNTFLISKAVKDKVKVILSGLGGDEFFAGYPVFHDVFNLQNKTFFDSLLRYFPKKILWHINKSYLINYNKSIFETLASKRCLFSTNKDCKDFLSKYYFKNKEVLKSVSIFEIKNYMSNMLLRDADAVGMHNSLEIRTPFVDKNILELVLSIPDKYKVDKHINKTLLVNTFNDLLLPEVYSGTKKGFALPMERWLKDYLNENIFNSIKETTKVYNLDKQLHALTHNRKNVTYLSMVLVKWLQKNEGYLCKGVQ